MDNSTTHLELNMHTQIEMSMDFKKMLFLKIHF